MPSNYQSYTKIPLSAGVNGVGILVNAIGPAGTLGNVIHVAVSGTVSVDEIVLYASCQSTLSTTPVLLTLQWGGIDIVGVVYPDEIKYQIQKGKGLQLICDHQVINNGLVIAAYVDAASANLCMIHGYVNRIAKV